MQLPGVPSSLWQWLREAAGTNRLALVGGAVRDLLLHRQHRDPWRGLVDLDLVIEADPDDPAFLQAAEASPAYRLVECLPQAAQGLKLCSVRPHGQYGTVEVELELEPGSIQAPSEGVTQLLLLDVASARLERYPIPGENPEVRFGRLEDDLARRDFSINAMALLFQPDGEATLLDPHGGQADLAARRLRLLHDGSLGDDPTRLLRAARYAARLGFDLADESRGQARSTLAAWPWAWSAGDSPEKAPPALGTRLRMELELLLEREDWRSALRHLQTWGGLQLLDAALQADRHWRRRLVWADRFGLPLPAALVAGSADPLALAERLQLPHRQHRLLAQHQELRRRLVAAGWTAEPRAAQRPCSWAPSRWCALLEAPGLSTEAVALALACGDGPRRPLLRWWLRWRHVKSPLRAADLIAQGVPRGPQLGQRLVQLRAEQLDQERL